MRNAARIILALLLAFMCAGCTSVTDVVSRADAYCTARGRKMVFSKLETHGMRNLTPEDTDLTFECVAVDDPRYEPPLDHRMPSAL